MKIKNVSGLGNRNYTREYDNTASFNYKLNFVNTYPFQIVSPFITGREYNGKINGVDNWQDDNIDTSSVDNDLFSTNNNFSDNTITGAYFVNDPSNKFDYATQSDGPFPGHSDRKNGFNDLQMRKEKLCQLLNLNCSESPGLLDIIQNIAHIPFPLGGH